MALINILFLCIDPKKEREEPAYFFYEIGGKIVLQHVVDQFTRIRDPYTLNFLVSSASESEIVKNIYPDAKVIITPGQTKGSAISSLIGSSAFPSMEELLIVSVNELIKIDFQELISLFRKSLADVGLISFKSHSPKYSYLLLDKNGQIVGFYQYKVKSDLATAGLFYFKKTEDFINFSSNMILKGASEGRLFYVGETINEYILDGRIIKSFEIKREDYVPLKNENDLISTAWKINENI